MKTHTEYHNLTPLEVAQIGECNGWPIKGLVVSDDGEPWSDPIPIKCLFMGRNVLQFGAEGRGYFDKCARPVEQIEFEVGDLVEILDHRNKGKFGKVISTDGPVCVQHSDSRKQTWDESRNLKPWTPGYGYTNDGELITALDGWEIVPEGEVLGEGYKIYHDDANGWLKRRGPFEGEPAKCLGEVRAYARRIDSIAPGHNPAGLTVSQVGEGWRLLSREEVEQYYGPKDKAQVFGEECWHKSDDIKEFDTICTYRTKMPEGHFLPKPERPEHEGEALMYRFWGKDTCAQLTPIQRKVTAAATQEIYKAGLADAKLLASAPAVTADTIEHVLRTLPDKDGDVICGDGKGWYFSAHDYNRIKQTADLAAALNEQLKGAK